MAVNGFRYVWQDSNGLAANRAIESTITNMRRFDCRLQASQNSWTLPPLRFATSARITATSWNKPWIFRSRYRP